MIWVLTIYLDQGAWLFAATRAVLVAELVSLGLIAVASLLLRDRAAGTLVGLCLALMSFAPFVGVILPILAAALAVVVSVSLTRRRFRRPYRLLLAAQNLIGSFGVVLLVVILAQFGLRGQIFGFSAPASASVADPGAPDIFVVLLDGYPRADTLERVWDLDNSAFLSGLEALGFHVSEMARSNYNSTTYTIPAMFNMQLLQDLKPWSEYAKPSDVPPADRAQALQRSHGLDVLREHGYRTTSISAGFTHEDIRAVDEFITTGQADLIEITLLGQTVLGDLLQAVDPHFAEHQVGQRVEANLGVLAQLAGREADRPQFVFAHIPAPHPPLSFASVERSPVPLREAFRHPDSPVGDDLLREAYQQHVDGLNQRVLSALRQVVQEAGDDSVIVVMSDHGSRTSGPEATLTGADVDEQFATLLAARTPDGAVIFGDDAITTNVLSTVFNHYLGTDIVQADRVFQSADGNYHPESG